ncbi:MAG: ROK family transcriptional regulator [Calditrichaeota bacterium]|nr:ROK family transcriptional regulator [Calditrichota bacterium]
MIREAGYGPKLVREYNELNILRFIKNDGPISRAELAKKYKLSKAAVSEIIGHLLNLGYIREIGPGNSTRLGGRKPILLEFNPKSGYAIGLEIKRDHARVALSDLNAKIYRLEYFSFTKGSSLKHVVEKVYGYIDEFMKLSWVKKARPIGIGVAIPGLINYDQGKIQESDTLKNWVGFPLRKMFEDRYNMEVIIENDVKTISLGECRFGNGKNIDNMIYLWVGDGLGAGIIIKGELYRGVSASAGEIGYYDVGYLIKNVNECRLLYNGHKNFGDILSDKVLVEGAKRGLENEFRDMLDKSKLSVDYILKTANEKNPLALELLREYGFLVGVVCINLINTLNPEMIIIGGQPLAHNQILINYIKDQIKHDILRTPSRVVKIKKAKLKQNAAIMGAVALVLEDLFYMRRLNIKKYREVFRN